MLDESRIEAEVIQQNRRREIDIQFLKEEKRGAKVNAIPRHLPLTSGLFKTSPIAPLIFSTVG